MAIRRALPGTRAGVWNYRWVSMTATPLRISRPAIDGVMSSACPRSSVPISRDTRADLETKLLCALGSRTTRPKGCTGTSPSERSAAPPAASGLRGLPNRDIACSRSASLRSTNAVRRSTRSLSVSSTHPCSKRFASDAGSPCIARRNGGNPRSDHCRRSH